MTIKELKAKIKDLPDNMDVMIVQTSEEFKYSLCEIAIVKDVNFSEGDVVMATDKCLVISDEI